MPAERGWAGSKLRAIHCETRSSRLAKPLTMAAWVLGNSGRMIRISQRPIITIRKTTNSSAPRTSARRPLIWPMAPSAEPAMMPGPIWAIVQAKAEVTLTTEKRVKFMPAMPAMPGTTDFTPGTNRPKKTLLPPWRRKNASPLSIMWAYLDSGHMLLILSLKRQPIQ